MDKAEIIKFINRCQTCDLATMDEKQPRVRGMMPYRADEEGIVFHTGSTKDLYKQIKANPLVELCFFDKEKNIQLRVQGKAVIKDDLDLKEKIVEDRPFLKPWVEEKGYDLLAVFTVVDCVAHTWTFETNFAPKEYIKITT